MAATALELFEGRTEKLALKKDEVSTKEIPWIVFSAADEAEATQAVFDTSDITLDGLTRVAIDLEERPNSTTWKFKVSYEGPSKDDKDKEDEEAQGGIYSFDTGGGTQHITQSFRTVSITPAANFEATDFNQAIGWDGQRIQGVDIAVPVFNFTVEISLSVEQVTPNYIRGLMEKTGKVNSDDFQVRILGSILEDSPTWKAGEVLFLGASGSREQQTKLDEPRDWKITLRFSALPNLKDVKVGLKPPIIVPDKKGWDYLWIAYEPEADPKAKVVVRKAAAVYVEEIYERTKFKDLVPS